MAVSWLKVLTSVPGLKQAVDALVAPGASKSKTVWYNLIKAVFGLLAAFGIYVELDDKMIQDLSATIPAVATGLGFLIDAFVSVWLRVRTIQALPDKVQK